jgi:hypothetical protein
VVVVAEDVEVVDSTVVVVVVVASPPPLEQAVRARARLSASCLIYLKARM